MTSPPVIDSRLLIAGEKGVHSGIPEAVFLEDVDAFMKGGESAEEILKKLDEQHQKFKFMLSNFDSKKKRLKAQVPDISTTLESVKHLKSKKDDGPIETKFVLSDQVYAKAIVPPTSRVSLWLGANTMLEYDIDEAEELLVKNLGDAKSISRSSKTIWISSETKSRPQKSTWLGSTTGTSKTKRPTENRCRGWDRRLLKRRRRRKVR